MVKISIIMPTVRSNYPYVTNKRKYIFSPIIQSLKRQTFKDFQLVIADYRKIIRRKFPSTSFQIKHIEPKQTIWDDIRYPAIYNGMNSAIIHSDGELIVYVPDCSVISPNFLERCWYWYKKGYFVAGLASFEDKARTEYDIRKNKYFCRCGVCNIIEGSIKADVKYLEKIKQLKREKAYHIQGHHATWGYNSYSLDALFKVNGVDEQFDGCNWCGDSDLGYRMGMAGYEFIVDTTINAFEYHHVNPYQSKDYLCGRKAKDNVLYGKLQWSKMRSYRANDGTVDRNWFDNYEANDFSAVEALLYFKSIDEYRPIRELYVKHPSNFNLKELWQQARECNG